MRWNLKSRTGKVKITFVIATLILFLTLIGKEPYAEERQESTFRLLAEQILMERLQCSILVLPAFLETEQEEGVVTGIFSEAMKKEFPLQEYLATAGGKTAEILAKEEAPTKDETFAKGEAIAKEEGLRKEEAALKEGSDEDNKGIEESRLDYDENALHIEESLMEELQKENRRYADMINGGSTTGEEMTPPESVKEMASEESGGFIKAAVPAYTYDWSKEWGYDELVSNFYAIDSSTELKEEYVSLDKLLNRDLTIEKSEGEEDLPRILIYHTHSQEAFADSREGETSDTIVGAGERLAELLREEYGFSVLHHTGEYDVENRDYAYSNSLPAIEALLEQYPSIEVVIDLHRDAVPEDTKLLMDLQGRPTARLMFFNGMSYSKGNGDIDYLENPYIEENLAFSFQAQVAANEYYPGIARRIYLKAYRYNMHLRAKSLLVELGAQTNTVEEIKNACDPLAHIIAIVLSDEL